MINHSDNPGKYSSINHQILDEGIRNGKINPLNYSGTVPLSEIPAYKEWSKTRESCGSVSMNTTFADMQAIAKSENLTDSCTQKDGHAISLKTKQCIYCGYYRNI